MQRPYQGPGHKNYEGIGRGRGTGLGAEEDNNWRSGGGGDNPGSSTRPQNKQLFNGDIRGSRGARHQRGRGGQNQRGRGRGQCTTSYRDQDKQELEPLPKEKVAKIVGICSEMCPRAEIILREREGLLHRFEIILEDVSCPSTNPSSPSSSWPVQGPSHISSNVGTNIPKRVSTGRNKPLPKADIRKTIKSFARSAAGQDKTLPEDLRPISVLKETVAYLCNEILPRMDSPFSVIYDFIFDRLRAVRQDLTIQRIETVDAIKILETIVKFHIYSEFRLREEPISIYDPHINQKHLYDCLRKLLSLYEFNDYLDSSRAEFEGLNCLVSINSYQVITRAFSIKKQINSPILNLGIDMALSYQCRNYVRFFRKMSQLPILLQMYCLRHVGFMRETAFRSMCIAYGVNSCKIPLSWITCQLLYTSVSELHRDLGHLNIEILRDEVKTEKFAKFEKAQINVIQSKAAGIKSEILSQCIQSIVKHTTNNSCDNGTISKLCLSF